MTERDAKELCALAKEARIEALGAIASIGVGHVGGTLSIIETLVYLYYRELRIDPANPAWPGRDIMILSKGHSGPALYAVLAMKGYFERAELATLNRVGTRLPSHCDMHRTPGVDMTAGSLGQGLSAAVGMALAARIDGTDRRVYCIIGDGEAQEGQIWEATMFAAQRKLDNLVVFLDDNALQLDGPTDGINSLRPVDSRWQGFGWEVLSVDGHDFADLEKALERARSITGRPVLVHLKTVKGRGISIAEGKPSSHSMALSREDYARCVTEIQDGVCHA